MQLTGVSERPALRDLAELVDQGLTKPGGGRGGSAAYRLRETGALLTRLWGADALTPA